LTIKEVRCSPLFFFSPSFLKSMSEFPRRDGPVRHPPSPPSRRQRPLASGVFSTCMWFLIFFFLGRFFLLLVRRACGRGIFGHTKEHFFSLRRRFDDFPPFSRVALHCRLLDSRPSGLISHFFFLVCIRFESPFEVKVPRAPFLGALSRRSRTLFVQLSRPAPFVFYHVRTPLDSALAPSDFSSPLARCCFHPSPLPTSLPVRYVAQVEEDSRRIPPLPVLFRL